MPARYGKSIAIAMAWNEVVKIGLCNRLLFVVANDAQRMQVYNDFPGDCELVGAPYAKGVWKYNSEPSTRNKAKTGEVVVFVIVVNSVFSAYQGRGVNMLKELVNTEGTKWMVAIDEYHHYGIETAWGEAARDLISDAHYTLCTSATPNRRANDDMFGATQVDISTRRALSEETEVFVGGKPYTVKGVIKKMVCNTYDYKVSVLSDGELLGEYTTTDLRSGALLCSGETIDQWEERLAIRYSPQFIWPLLTEPIMRANALSAKYGMRLQTLIRAFSVAHAKMVCKQIQSLFPDLYVDWVGTGIDGRTDEQNRMVMERFCPKKDPETGERNPSLDVLVQVNMAGEGVDCRNVVEVIDLKPVAMKNGKIANNQDDQFYSRGGTQIVVVCSDGSVVSLYAVVNVPTDHYLAAEYSQKELWPYFDRVTPEDKGDNDGDGDGGGFVDSWEISYPKHRMVDHINTYEWGSDEQRRDHERYQESKGSNGQWVPDWNDLSDSEKQQEATFFHSLKSYAQEQQSVQAFEQQLRATVDGGVGKLARKMCDGCDPITGAMIGRNKALISMELTRQTGKKRAEMEAKDFTWCIDYLNSELARLKGLQK